VALPDLTALSQAGGWVVAVATLLAVLGLIVTGKLVPGPTHDRALKREDDLRETAASQTAALKGLTDGVDFMGELILRQLGEAPRRSRNRDDG
jgi:hypothetical protein